MKIIEAEGINKFFGTGQNRVHVLKDMSFAIEEGPFQKMPNPTNNRKIPILAVASVSYLP